MTVSDFYAYSHITLLTQTLTRRIDILLSLVRTRSIGYLRDIRRLTVALSRARLGLYILGRRSVFESVFELKPAFDVLLQRPDKLTLVTNEMYGETQRAIPSTFPTGSGVQVEDEDVPGQTAMESVEHLGQYVYEMTNAKINAMRANGGELPTREVKMAEPDEAAMENEDADEDRPENVLLPEAQAELNQYDSEEE
jgi:intron-binding protein aquarius